MSRTKVTKEEFISRIKCMFFQKYTLVSSFINIKTKVVMSCPEHGNFYIIPRNMLYKNEGCKLCGIEKMARTKSLTKQEFEKKANAIHHNKYDYTLAFYKNYETKIKIICKKCGNIFEMTPNNHLKGLGCKCFNQSLQHQVFQDS